MGHSSSYSLGSALVDGANPLGLRVPNASNWLEAKDYDVAVTANIRTSVSASAYEGRAFKFTATEAAAASAQGRVRINDDAGTALTGDIYWGARIGMRRLVTAKTDNSLLISSFIAGIIDGVAVDADQMVGSGYRNVQDDYLSIEAMGCNSAGYVTEGAVGASPIAVGNTAWDVFVARVSGTVTVYTGRPGEPMSQHFVAVANMGTTACLLSLRHLKSGDVGHSTECFLLGERLFSSLPF